MRECVVGLGHLGGFDGHGASGFKLVEGLAGGVFSEANGRQQVVVRSESVLVGDTVVVGGLEAVKRDLELTGFAFEKLLADLDGAGALVLVEPVLDLVAGAGGLREAEPVARGVVISTMSPLRSLWRKGTMRPLTLAAVVAWPTSVWMA
jgi:hypothetical protein